VLWVALDYRRLGEDLGALARRVLNGERPQAIPLAVKVPVQVEVDETLVRKWSGYPPAHPGRDAKHEETAGKP
jgi:hypothetical protein